MILDSVLTKKLTFTSSQRYEWGLKPTACETPFCPHLTNPLGSLLPFIHFLTSHYHGFITFFFCFPLNMSTSNTIFMSSLVRASFPPETLKALKKVCEYNIIACFCLVILFLSYILKWKVGLVRFHLDLIFLK